ncbi:alpha/beta-hydrolase [Mycena rebaudengoi]|nr:alpha/beta-hydrolase [Mycena rebaudengoi]
MLAFLRFAVAFMIAARCWAQGPSTFPHSYPGIPATPFGPDWQAYFKVTRPLPNVTGAIPSSFAGNVGVGRANHPNATLFFWAFEKKKGSLTGAAAHTDPWIIWLNGGPGSSSFLGLMTENGPIQITGNYSIVHNKFSWDKLADTFWVDQPVGTGYSTSDSTGYVPDEDQMGADFVGFLANIVKIFPSLAKRPLYLTGESYAGSPISIRSSRHPLTRLLFSSRDIYCKYWGCIWACDLTRWNQPYITKIFSTPSQPVNLKKIAIGDGTMGSTATWQNIPTLTIIQTYPQLINFDPDVFNYFKTQGHLCGLDMNLTYPQNGPLPTPKDPLFGFGGQTALRVAPKPFKSLIAQGGRISRPPTLPKRELALREERRQSWKRDLTNRPNGTVDPWYGCSLLLELADYALNYSFPWTLGGLDPYYLPDALNPEVPSDPTFFLNDKRTRTALHAPTSKDWVQSFDLPFGGSPDFPNVDPSPEPMTFLTELATNASAKGVGIVFYSGNDDGLVAHRGTEGIRCAYNMTFGGVQGFSRKPSTPFTDDAGNFAGIIHQERGVTYALFQNAGHLVPSQVPAAAFAFVRDFILGSKHTGLVDSKSGKVIGGEDPKLALDVMPGNTVIYYGDGRSATTTLSTVVPSATLAVWNKFIKTATATQPAGGTGTGCPGGNAGTGSTRLT